MEIRTLKPNEIEARVQIIKDTGCSLLLYKDARCDMKILDEVFGPLGWKRKHEVIGNNLYCTVSIFDKENKQWIDKQDVGTESFTQKEKGQASDSFKRACFNIGIGRELYTAPFIWIKLNKGETYTNKGKPALSKGIKFSIGEIEYDENREVSLVTIVDEKGNERYRYGVKSPSKIDKNKADTLINLAELKETDINTILGFYKVEKATDLMLPQWTQAMERLKVK